MGAKLNWTAEQDDTIRSMLLAGKNNADVARALGLSWDSVTNRARAINAVRAYQGKPNKIHPTPTREPYPPGHPITWGAITAGTLLAGVPYPIQPLVTRAPPEERDEWEANMAEWRMAA